MTRWGPAALILLLLPRWPAVTSPGLQDAREHWTIGIAAFDASKASSENVYLAHSIPLLLRERLEAVGTHHLDEEGRLAAGRSVLRERLREQVAALARLRKERDELLFGAGRAEKTAEYDRRIARILEEVRRLKAAAPQDVEVPATKPVRFAEGSEGGLMQSAVRSAVEAARSSKLDLLIWGSVEQLEGYLFVQAHAFDADRGRLVFDFREASGVDGVGEVVAGLGQELARLVWGREWASLSVRTEPAGALVWVNDEFAGRSPVRLEFVLPGSARLRVEAPGFAPSVQEMELQAFSAAERTVTLQAVAGRPLALQSAPEGADVYVGADWLGRTPLEIPRPEGANRLVLRKEGYLDRSVYLGEPGEEGGAAAGNTLSVSLLPQEFDPAAEQRARRDSFYRAFGLFALSVPLPFFCWGFAGDYAVGFAGSLDPQLESSAKGYYLAYLGTLALSGGLFANALVRLLRYVRAADRKA